MDFRGFAKTEYTPNLNASLIAAVKEELQQKEEQQKRHYVYLNELQNMARELPGRYQQRVPYELLSGIAQSVLDGTVFEIINSLKEVQQLEERHLSGQRIELVNNLKMQKAQLLQKHKEDLMKCLAAPHNKPLIEQQHRKELQELEKKSADQLKKKDMKIILALDQKVMEQQITLERAGVPGFFVTNNSQDLQLQMYLINFMNRLSQMGS